MPAMCSKAAQIATGTEARPNYAGLSKRAMTTALLNGMPISNALRTSRPFFPSAKYHLKVVSRTIIKLFVKPRNRSRYIRARGNNELNWEYT